MSTSVLWQLHRVPTIIMTQTYNYNDSKSNPSLLRTPTIPRKSPRKQKIGVDELVLFQATDKIIDIDSISEQNSPEYFIFKILDNSVQIFKLKYNKETGILAVNKCIIETSIFFYHIMV